MEARYRYEFKNRNHKWIEITEKRYYAICNYYTDYYIRKTPIDQPKAETVKPDYEKAFNFLIEQVLQSGLTGEKIKTEVLIPELKYVYGIDIKIKIE